MSVEYGGPIYIKLFLGDGPIKSILEIHHADLLRDLAVKI